MRIISKTRIVSPELAREVERLASAHDVQGHINERSYWIVCYIESRLRVVTVADPEHVQLRGVPELSFPDLLTALAT